MVTQLISWLP